MDKDGNGTISISEFLNMLNLTFITPLVFRVFRAFDLDGSGELDLGEFIVSVWNYCTSTTRDHIAFFFDLYDTDRDGTMTNAELRQMILDANGKEKHISAHCQKLLKVFEERGSMNMRDFINFAADGNSALFFPMRVMQTEIRRQLATSTFWKRLGDTRREVFVGQDINLRFLRSLFHDEGYIERARMRLHSLEELPKRLPYFVKPSITCLIYILGYKNKMKVRTATSWENQYPKFETCVDFYEIHTSDKICIELLDWPHKIRLPWRALDSHRPYGFAVVRMNQVFRVDKPGIICRITPAIDMPKGMQATCPRAILSFVCYPLSKTKSHRALRKRAIPESGSTSGKLTSMQRWRKEHSTGIQARKKIPLNRFNSYIQAYLQNVDDKDEGIESIALIT